MDKPRRGDLKRWRDAPFAEESDTFPGLTYEAMFFLCYLLIKNGREAPRRSAVAAIPRRLGHADLRSKAHVEDRHPALRWQTPQRPPLEASRDQEPILRSSQARQVGVAGRQVTHFHEREHNLIERHRAYSVRRDFRRRFGSTRPMPRGEAKLLVGIFTPTMLNETENNRPTFNLLDWRPRRLIPHIAQIGRTSMAPTCAPGQRAAQAIAPSRSGASIR